MLLSYGWTDDRQRDFLNFEQEGLEPARVLEQQRSLYRVITEDGELNAQLAGRLVFEAPPGALPVAGDWVAIDARRNEGGATIHHVLPRASVVRRKPPHGLVQTIAANIDIAFLVAALNGDFNMRRIERYLALARESGAAPVILLTKADLCANIAARVADVERVAGDAPVHALSAMARIGLTEVARFLRPGKTAALLGSSGAGKSTLVNALAGEDVMATATISGDGKRGRHTTTHRELFLLPSGALLLDSPGMRELSVAGAEVGVSASFEEVEAIAAQCRFRDCTHDAEPGCSVRAALESGDLDGARWRSYQKLQRELAFEARKTDSLARQAHHRVWAQHARNYRARKKHRDRQDDD